MAISTRGPPCAARRGRTPTARARPRAAAASRDRRSRRAWYQRRASRVARHSAGTRRMPCFMPTARLAPEPAAGCGSSISRRNSSGGGSSSKTRHGACAAQLLDRVAAGGDGNRARADGVGAVDVVRRVADDEHVASSATGPARRASSQRARGDRRALARVLGERAVGKEVEQAVVRQLGLRAAARVAGQQVRAHVVAARAGARGSRARSAARAPASAAGSSAAAPRSAAPCARSSRRRRRRARASRTSARRSGSRSARRSRIDASWKSRPVTSLHRIVPREHARPWRSSAACRRYPRTGRSSRVAARRRSARRQRRREPRHQARDVEPMVRQHLVVGAALGQLRRRRCA